MKHTFKLSPEPFYAVNAGYKTIELRLWDKKRRALSVGDTIEFVCTDGFGGNCERRVKALHLFEDFAKLYDALPLLECGYTPRDVYTASPSDMEQYYTESQVKKCGVVGIELEYTDNALNSPLHRFIAAQNGSLPGCADHDTALRQIKQGRKPEYSHWMWYVFPELAGVFKAHGFDDTVTRYYELTREEAQLYISHPVLGSRLLEISQALLALDSEKLDLISIFGNRYDAEKLVSCMTLFKYIAPEHTVFREVLEKFYPYRGEDKYTAAMLMRN